VGEVARVHDVLVERAATEEALRGTPRAAPSYYRLQIGRLRSTKPGRRRLIGEADLLALLAVGSIQPERSKRAGDRRR
jgi:hypothetical protein